MHLSLPQATFGHKGVRTQETEAILEIIKAHNERFILTGDFNAGVAAKSVKAISNELIRVDSELAQPTWGRSIKILGGVSIGLQKRLDYIFTTPDISVVSAKVLDRHPSDHHPLTVDIKLSQS